MKSKINEEQLRDILDRWRDGEHIEKLAEEYGFKNRYSLIKSLRHRGYTRYGKVGEYSEDRKNNYKPKKEPKKDNKGDYLYMYVTKDEYELPMLIADSPSELAKMLGININLVYMGIYRSRTSKYKSRYKKVYVGD